MPKPLHAIGTRVFYPIKNQFGKVTSIINKDNPADKKIQGYRCEVQLDDGWIYSVREVNLIASNLTDTQEGYLYVQT